MTSLAAWSALAWIADHLWQSTLFALATAALTLAFRTNRAAVRHALWMAASTKFLLPFAAFVSLGQVMTSVGGGLFGQDVQIAELDALSRPFTPATGTITAVGTANSGILLQLLPWVLVAVWGAGTIWLLATWGLRWRRMTRTLSATSRAASGPEHDALRRLEHESNARRPVALYITDTTQEPGIFGILQPALMWPRALSKRLTGAHIEAILSHELAHVRRRDNLSSSLHAVVQALFWFHPFVWWIGIQLSATREQACDEAVVASGHDRHTYAESILRTCEFRVEWSRTGLAGVTSANLTQRVTDIMTEERRTSLCPAKMLLLTLVTVLAIGAPIALGGLTGSRLFAQIPTPAPAGGTPAFDVATIKKRTSPEGPVRLVGCAANGRLIVENYPVDETILVAYGLDKFQLTGAGGWVQSDRYDIEAKAPDRCQPGEGLLMLRTLLADRFGLTMHVETRQLPIYVLVSARKDRKFGPQLTRAEERCAELWRRFDRGGPRPSGTGAAPCQRATRIAPDHISLRLTRMRTFAKDILGRRVGRTVIDQTGFDTDDLFDMELSFAPDSIAALAADSPRVIDDRPSLFTALEEQLGLKLVPRVGPAEVMVIDSIKRPTEN